MGKIVSELGQRLRKLRSEKGETLHQVSMGTDIDSPLLSKIERGYRLPTQEQMSKLASYFGISETEMKVMVTAEKIIKEFGISKTTYEAVKLVAEQIGSYGKKDNAK